MYFSVLRQPVRHKRDFCWWLGALSEKGEHSSLETLLMRYIYDMDCETEYSVVLNFWTNWQQEAQLL